MLHELIKILNDADAGFDHQQIAEALWLAQFDARVETLPAASVEPKRDEQKKPDSERKDSTATQQQTQKTPSKNLHTKTTTRTDGVSFNSAQSVRVADVSALPDALAMGRALRPLRRRVASRFDFRLDEEATAEASAEAGGLAPVLSPAAERWFDLELVVEQSSSMIVWRDVARELQQLMEQLGAFSDVRRWQLSRNGDKAILRDAAGREHSAKTLADASRRRLVMVVSDGSSRGWADGVYGSTVKMWSRTAPVVLCQMLGERLWPRTVVGNPTAEVSSPSPGAPNSELKVILPWWEKEFVVPPSGGTGASHSVERKNSQAKFADQKKKYAPVPPEGGTTNIALPVISLSPVMFGRWARMVASPGRNWRAALIEWQKPELPKTAEQTPVSPRKRAGMLWKLVENIFPETVSKPIQQPTPAVPATPQVSAIDRIEAFRRMASPQAYELAVYLSLMPLTLPVMRVTQAAMIRNHSQEQLAEFLLSGLVRVSANAAEQAGSLSHADPVFEFLPGVSDALLPAFSRDEVERLVRNAVSDLIGRRLGSVRDFIALITSKDGKEKLPSIAQSFAEITLPGLRKLGYEFDSGDETGRTTTEIPPPPMGIDGSPSPVEMLSFEFRTVRLNPDGNIQKQDTGHAWQFIEKLSDKVPLDMVFVPGGKFLMGAPKSEKDSYDWERPQHAVTVQPFYIGKFTVTQAQWRVVAGWPKINIDLKPEPSRFKGENRPVETISWHEAKEFCARLSKQTGGLYRLPTEAEWEYACRAGTTTPFAFGETITPKFVNYNGEYPYGKAKKGQYRAETVPVGSLGVANDFGLFDMHGNVWEWCEDDWVNNYDGAPMDGSARKLSGKDSTAKLLRGGSCNYDARLCRAAYRNDLDASHFIHYVGLRVVVSVRTRP